MDGLLRNMTSVSILKGNQILLLYRQGGKVVNNVWIASADGHFEKNEINDACACVMREMKEELGLTSEDVNGLKLRYIGLRNVNGEISQHYLEAGSYTDILYAGVANGKELIFTEMPEC